MRTIAEAGRGGMYVSRVLPVGAGVALCLPTPNALDGRFERSPNVSECPSAGFHLLYRDLKLYRSWLLIIHRLEDIPIRC